jgi:hypothetical protein
MMYWQHRTIPLAHDGCQVKTIEADVYGALAVHRTTMLPWEVGRQATVSAQITDTVAWLAASGWQGDRGQLQCYALYLLEMRDRYERVGVS